MKKIALLGATGSIGTQTLDIIKSDRNNFELTAVSAYSNSDSMIGIIDEFRPRFAVMMDKAGYDKVYEYCKIENRKTEVLHGMEGLIEIATLPEVNIVVTALVGMVGILPTVRAIEAGKDIALANKETLVAAGELVINKAKEHEVNILPVDSEHSAIFQCLQGNSLTEINKIILTASGGPFRGRTFEEVKYIPKTEALKHPKWNMGNKITIDSATLMNKGLEVIEAHWLFSQPYEKICPVVHPESIIHSAIEYIDGSIIAQLGVADMRLPIQYALNYPRRMNRVVEPLDLVRAGRLTFEEPSYENFPCLRLAFEAGKQGKLLPAIMNCANELSVDLYLKEKISFGDIYYIINECMEKFDYNKAVTIENILESQEEVIRFIKNKYN
ncbi:MAG: 1-deoxy-D-xylulose-5-phosphate reductoisomerase [Bacillota bacterium]|nr:1-deoxy-D-xylulose-5-phosphate reductoisomerase [Bacillota bacterium]